MSGEKRVGKRLRLWRIWLRESRAVLILYFATVLLFLVTGSLYHLENLGKLLYAALLTAAVWGAVGVIRGKKYVDRCELLEGLVEQYEDCGELLGGELEEAEEFVIEGSQIHLLRTLVRLAEDARRRERSRWEEKETDRKDYYMMWTHQIKTPIAALRLLLEENQDARESFRMREELFKIEQYAEMVLTFQRLDSISSDMALERYDLGKLLRQAVRKYSVLFINKGLRVSVPETTARVLTDEKWFSFCLEQLLSNSIKYTVSGEIRFEVEEEEDRVLLTLEDTGIGIRPEDLPRIFEKGFTGYNGRMDKRSTGIGLYLCKQVFDRLGIRIQADSRVGKGTRMLLTLQKGKRASE
ncbi:MAG: sensor histidine kinase [Roseburia sp.]|nr:sensor histidine kinase [Roseburia sp.]MCM1099373.1 sensor histidine kinase [Ruminococcus flavefaciens]